jgi:predicted MFS family arabinose efflux permease
VAIAISYAIQAVGMALAAPLGSFGLVLAGTFMRGVGGGIGWVFSTQLLLQLLPNKVRGRVFSTEFAMFTLANAAGAMAGGWALDHPTLDLSGILWWMGGLILLPGLLWSLWIAVKKPVVSIDEARAAEAPQEP